MKLCLPSLESDLDSSEAQKSYNERTFYLLLTTIVFSHLTTEKNELHANIIGLSGKSGLITSTFLMA